MTNEALHFLCNTGALQQTNLPDTDYVVRGGEHPLFQAADSLRRKLKLNDPFSSWFWRPYMAAMAMDVTFRQGFDWQRVTVSPFAGKQVAPQFFNCRPAGTTDRPMFTWKPDYLPDSFDFNFTWTAPNSASYVNGSRNGTVYVSVFMDKQLNIDIKDILPGCDFGVIPNSDWESGSTLAFKLQPITYPVKQVLRTVEDSSKELYMLLSAYAMSEYYSACPDEVNRLGIIGYVIAKATKDYGE